MNQKKDDGFKEKLSEMRKGIESFHEVVADFHKNPLNFATKQIKKERKALDAKTGQKKQLSLSG